MNIKVVGGKQKVLVNYVDASAPGPPGVVLLKPFQIKYFVVHFCLFLIKNHMVQNTYIN